MSALLDQAAKEAKEGNFDLKQQVRHIGNYFPIQWKPVPKKRCTFC